MELELESHDTTIAVEREMDTFGLFRAFPSRFIFFSAESSGAGSVIDDGRSGMGRVRRLVEHHRRLRIAEQDRTDPLSTP